MSIAIALVIVIAIIAGVSTFLLAGKGDEDYRSNAGRNTKNLSLIYLVVMILSFVAVGIYIKWFS